MFITIDAALVPLGIGARAVFHWHACSWVMKELMTTCPELINFCHHNKIEFNWTMTQNETLTSMSNILNADSARQPCRIRVWKHSNSDFLLHIHGATVFRSWCNRNDSKSTSAHIIFQQHLRGSFFCTEYHYYHTWTNVIIISRPTPNLSIINNTWQTTSFSQHGRCLDRCHINVHRWPCYFMIDIIFMNQTEHNNCFEEKRRGEKSNRQLGRGRLFVSED